jgi:hypothetical protein
MHKNAAKCNKTQRKWCINKHGASKIIDTFGTYQTAVTFQIGVQKLLKIYFGKAQNMTNSNMLIDESVRNTNFQPLFC